jgi:hypothetical protein
LWTAHETLDQLGQFVLPDERVDGHEDAPTWHQRMSIRRDLLQLLEREVLRLGPRRELLEAEVDRIGPEVKRRERRLDPARGREQLGLAQRRVEGRHLQGHLGLSGVILPLRHLRLGEFAVGTQPLPLRRGRRIPDQW